MYEMFVNWYVSYLVNNSTTQPNTFVKLAITGNKTSYVHTSNAFLISHCSTKEHNTTV